MISSDEAIEYLMTNTVTINLDVHSVFMKSKIFSEKDDNLVSQYMVMEPCTRKSSF